MARLYVDCDMTLVLWQDGLEHPYEGAERYVRNQPLIDAIEKFLGNSPDYGLTVWSFGGMEYARGWARRFGLDIDGVMAKDIRVPQPGDICIDDMPLRVRSIIMTPDQFVSYVDESINDTSKWRRARADDAIRLFDKFVEIDGVRAVEDNVVRCAVCGMRVVSEVEMATNHRFMTGHVLEIDNE